MKKEIGRNSLEDVNVEQAVTKRFALDPTKADRFLKMKEVMAMTSLGSSTIYRLMYAGKFPKSRQLSANCVRWRESEIEQWMNKLPTVEYGKWADPERRPLDT